MTITISDRSWKWVAAVLALALFGYVVIWPRLDAGLQAAAYINQCISVGACPTVTQLSEAAAARNKPAPVPTPTPTPTPKGQ